MATLTPTQPPIPLTNPPQTKPHPQTQTQTHSKTSLFLTPQNSTKPHPTPSTLLLQSSPNNPNFCAYTIIPSDLKLIIKVNVVTVIDDVTEHGDPTAATTSTSTRVVEYTYRYLWAKKCSSGSGESAGEYVQVLVTEYDYDGNGNGNGNGSGSSSSESKESREDKFVVKLYGKDAKLFYDLVVKSVSDCDKLLSSNSKGGGGVSRSGSNLSDRSSLVNVNHGKDINLPTQEQQTKMKHKIIHTRSKPKSHPKHNNSKNASKQVIEAVTEDTINSKSSDAFAFIFMITTLYVNRLNYTNLFSTVYLNSKSYTKLVKLSKTTKSFFNINKRELLQCVSVSVSGGGEGIAQFVLADKLISEANEVKSIFDLFTIKLSKLLLPKTSKKSSLDTTTTTTTTTTNKLLGLPYIIGSIKTKPSLLSKANRKYNSNVLLVKDVLRSTLILPSLSTLTLFLSKLLESKLSDCVVGIDFKRVVSKAGDVPNAYYGGYRDVVINVILSPKSLMIKQICEISVTLQSYYSIVSSNGSKHYTHSRDYNIDTLPSPFIILSNLTKIDMENIVHYVQNYLMKDKVLNDVVWSDDAEGGTDEVYAFLSMSMVLFNSGSYNWCRSILTKIIELRVAYLTVKRENEKNDDDEAIDRLTGDNVLLFLQMYLRSVTNKCNNVDISAKLNSITLGMTSKIDKEIEDRVYNASVVRVDGGRIKYEAFFKKFNFQKKM